ncbi:YdbH domain-containing protein [Sphingomonas sp. RS2018]
MTDAEGGTGSATGGRRRMRKRWRALIALLIVFVIAVVGLWTQRKPIASDFVKRELARRGVPARYEVASIGLSRQRLTNVVIGDPADPDLVADWVEVDTHVGLSGASVTGLAAGRVRMRARLKDGTLSFGAIDRLLPPPSGKPFGLPNLDARLEDVRLRVEAPQGVVGVKLSGSGRLDDGFAGRMAAVSRRLDVGGCRIDGAAAATRVRVSAGRPTIEGPVRAALVACGETKVAGVAADAVVTLGAALERWTGRARVAAASTAATGASVGQAMGQVTFAGTAAATTGDVRLTVATPRFARGSAESAGVEGRYKVGTAGAEFAGRARIAHGRVDAETLARLRADGVGAATPVAPLVQALSKAVVAAAADLSGEGALEAVLRGGGSAVRVRDLDLASGSGARLRIDGAPLRFGSVEVGGRIALNGGGLPAAEIVLAQAAGGLNGRATIAPYAAGGARLALTPVTFTAAGGAVTRVATTATLSGPLGDGRVEALRVPIDARWRGGRLAINTACTPVAWQRLAVSGLVLDPARLALCPTGAALVTIDGGRMGGGARIAAPRLAGTLGGSPLTLASTGATLDVGGRGLTLGDVAARIGSPGRVTRIDAARINGRMAAGGVAGEFSGAGGQIGAVPLILSDAGGGWRLTGGVLDLTGTLGVSDAATEPRFNPLKGNDVRLRLAGGEISAGGVLAAPKDGSKVADVTVVHRLSSGAGRARLSVPGIVFDEKGLQPRDLTPIADGVVAEVNGRVDGVGDIAWHRDGVTSTGNFGTDDTDLAAAFGPVTGIKGRIIFTDLLGLVSAPDQVVTVATINPGIAVENGTIRYRLMGGARVAIAGGRWPFAGGTLSLEPTLLDFDATQQRRMTFTVERADAAAFLQQFDFGNLNATGIFDGTLPMVFDQNGGRIENGRLKSRAGGSIAYLGAITEKDLGVWGNMAFQALRALDYRELDLTLNGSLAGEMVTAIRFAGVSQGAGTKSNFLIRRLAKLPFVFNITIRAPFRQLMDSVRSYYDPARLIQRNLPALMEERRRREQGLPPTPPSTLPPAPPTVQRPESETMR